MTTFGSPKPIADHELSFATATTTASENILMLPHYHAGFSDDIRGNTFIMLAAGHETSAGVLQFILELANNPVSQISLHGAIDEICGDGDPPL
ncbi:hypothetical protein FGADI_11087 [Fusarium gaditjirri]|uniref:Uncharacterized protein n=1 Tax=Fusarium gaditjirri TaxID=282569 RepID=A0A8H4SVN1_9HYPO|nr:hypothetical protein FGADI_11087 [Fusarium gaditjirri]